MEELRGVHPNEGCTTFCQFWHKRHQKTSLRVDRFSQPEQLLADPISCHNSTVWVYLQNTLLRFVRSQLNFDGNRRVTRRSGSTFTDFPRSGLFSREKQNSKLVSYTYFVDHHIWRIHSEGRTKKLSKLDGTLQNPLQCWVEETTFESAAKNRSSKMLLLVIIEILQRATFLPRPPDLCMFVEFVFRWFTEFWACFLFGTLSDLYWRKGVARGKWMWKCGLLGFGLLFFFRVWVSLLVFMKFVFICCLMSSNKRWWTR